MKHIIIYKGLNVSLALMQEMYGPQYIEWPNKRTDVSGTLQRPPYPLEDFNEWVERLRKEKGKNEVFAVIAHDGEEDQSKHRYIGHMGIHNIQYPHGVAATGSIFGPADAQGRGYGTEAKLLIQYHAFMVLGLRKLISDVKAFNGNSLGHLIKCGYQIVGRRKAHLFHEGEYVDEILLECFREDWWPIWDTYLTAKTLPRLLPEQKVLIEKETNQKKND